MGLTRHGMAHLLPLLFGTLSLWMLYARLSIYLISHLCLPVDYFFCSFFFFFLQPTVFPPISRLLSPFLGSSCRIARGQRLPCHVVIQVLWPKVSHSWLVRQGSLFQQTSMAVSGLSGLFSQELYSTKLMKLLPWSAVNCIKGAGNCKIRGKLSVAFFHFAPALHCTV